MSLSEATLLTELRKFCDSSYSGFEGFPTSSTEAAQKWASAYITYLREASNPIFLNLSSAQSTGAVVLTNIGTANAAFTVLPAGLTAMATAAAALAAPFAVIPPVGSPLIVFTNGTTAVECLTPLVRAIHLWTLTGLASISPAPSLPWA